MSCPSFSRSATKKSCCFEKLATIVVVERYACKLRGDIVDPRLVYLRFPNINGLPDCVKSQDEIGINRLDVPTWLSWHPYLGSKVQYFPEVWRCGRRHVPILMGCPGRQRITGWRHMCSRLDTRRLHRKSDGTTGPTGLG